MPPFGFGGKEEPHYTTDITDKEDLDEIGKYQFMVIGI